MTGSPTTFLLLLICIAFTVSAQTPLAADSRTLLNHGADAYQNSNIIQALTEFEKAIAIDPNNVYPHLYLALASMAGYSPGEDIEFSVTSGKRAKSELQLVLGLDPRNSTALNAMGLLVLAEASAVLGISDSQRPAKLKEARVWFLRAVTADPGNRDAYCTIGEIDWSMTSTEITEARAAEARANGGAQETSGPIANAAKRRELSARFAEAIEDGVANVRKALAIDPNHHDSLSLMAGLSREKAYLSDSVEEFRRNMEEADDWLAKSRATPVDPSERTALRQPLPPLPREGPAMQRISVAADVQAAKLLRKAEPLYPELARVARVQGHVKLTVVVDAQGRVVNAQLIGGHPLLVQAALDAVHKYVYSPTMVNGVAAEVVTQVDVEFVLTAPN